MTTLTTVLLVSLFGSVHCAGMCGPLVAFALGSTEKMGPTRRWTLQLAYHGGRLATYTLLGAVCGLLGAALDLGGSLVGLNRLAAVLAGAMMVAVGLVAVASCSGFRTPRWSMPRGLRAAIAFGQRAAMGLNPLRRALAIGLLTGLLPCGWLYAFAIVAAGTGSMLVGAAVMAAFWLGTVPVLASLGIGVHALVATLGRRLPLATALVIVGLGLYTIAARPAVSIDSLRPLLDSSDGNGPAATAQSIRQADLPCCAHGPKSSP
ncbi:MAG: sulfite exporter TauE/SafE family protein [Thermoguttaceae bacterium]